MRHRSRAVLCSVRSDRASLCTLTYLLEELRSRSEGRREASNQHWWQHLKLPQHKVKAVTEGGVFQPSQGFCPTRQKAAFTQERALPRERPSAWQQRKPGWIAGTGLDAPHLSHAPTNSNTNDKLSNFMIRKPKIYHILMEKGRNSVGHTVFPIRLSLFHVFHVP